MNDLQRLLKLKNIHETALARTTGLNYHSVQKTVKGVRKTPAVQDAVAATLGFPKDKLFGPGSGKLLRRLIQTEIKKKAARIANEVTAELSREYLKKAA